MRVVQWIAVRRPFPFRTTGADNSIVCILHCESCLKWSPLLAVALFTPSAFLLGHAVKQLPAATVYAAFTGIATAGTAIIGMAFFGESANFGRVCCLLLILIGVIGLKLFSGPVG